MTSNDNIGAFFANIGEMLAHDTGGAIDGVFIYREFDQRAIGGQAFRDLGDRVIWLDVSYDLEMYMLEFWEALPSAEQWKAMQYSISGEAFHVELDYGEQWDDDEHTSDRADRIVAARFGNKQIDYGRFPGDPA